VDLDFDMEDGTKQCQSGCRGACLHQVEYIPSADEISHDGHDETGFCNFVCQFVSVDCLREDVCIEQPCANFALCGNKEPQWLLDCYGGLCVQPCDMMWGRIFEFSAFAGDDVCPVCLEPGVASVVYECNHMVCARCYGKAAYSDAATTALLRCPTCRLDGQPRTRPAYQAIRHASIFGCGGTDFNGLQ
jgi:hypothetical protein